MSSQPPNLRRAPGPNNWRSGAIPSKAVLQQLRDRHGIRTVVNLAYDSMRKQRGEGCSYKSNPCEPIWARELGLEYIPAYLGSGRKLPKYWSKIKAAMMKGNALIHCTYGADRTGAVIGRFRLETERGVSPEAVLQEALSHGFKPRSHPGYGKGPDPNRRLREFMLAGRYQGPAPSSASGALMALPGGWMPWAIGGAVGLFLLLILIRTRRRPASSA